MSTEGPTTSTPWPQPSEDLNSSWRWWYRSPRSRRASSIIRYRRLFICGTDRVGLGPENLQEGDIAVVLLGGPVPCILRLAATDSDIGQRFELIGERYVHSAMHGETLHNVRKKVKKECGILPPTSSGPCFQPSRRFSIVWFITRHATAVEAGNPYR